MILARLLACLGWLPGTLASTQPTHYGRDLVHADVDGSVSNVTIEGFTYGGCFSADVAAGALGSNYTVAPLTAQSPSACADACVDWEVFLVGAGSCYCAEPSEFALETWKQLEETLCDAPCDAWPDVDFGGLVAYFQTLPGFCGGISVETFSFYEVFDAVNAVGQGTLDRDRGLWYQVVLVQTLLGGPPEHAGLFEDGSWRWRLHASSAVTGRAAFPLHRDLDEPIVGLLMDYMEGNPSVLGTSYSGSVYTAAAGSRHPVQLLVDSASYPGHTVDDAAVEPGAAPVLTFDQDRRVLFTAQPIGGEDSSLYGLELDAPNDMPYRHIRFTPSCNNTWCAVNELRFRYQEVEIDLSSATTYFLNDLSDPQLRNGAILVDFTAPIFIDEFSFSMPYNSSVNAPSRWVLEGTNDRVRRCILAGAPDYQAMGDGTYAQRNGETLYGRSVYRDSSGGIMYFDDASASWWVSPSIQEGGYGAIRCVGTASDPHLLTSPCLAWNGQVWDVAPNVTFDCLGNEWVVLHRQSRLYILPEVITAPLLWFRVSRRAVEWTLLIENISGHVGQLESDPEDGYVSAGITAGGESLLRTLGRIGGDTTSGDRCSVTLRVNVSFVEGSDVGTAIDCAATAFGIGGWLLPDLPGSGKLWLTCANTTELEANPWVQRYAEATADASFSFSSGELQKSPDAHALKSQIARILEIAVSPTLVVSLAGPLNYFECPLGTNCTFAPGLQVRIIKGGKTCGCAEEVLTIETHGFYKACYCLSDLVDLPGQSNVACDTDGDFTSLAGIVLGMGPEPARLVALYLTLGHSWQADATGFTSHAPIYEEMLQYAAGLKFGSLQFPSVVQITNASAPVCGYNLYACDLVGEVFCTLGEACSVLLNGTSLRNENGLKVGRISNPCASRLEYPSLAAFEGLVNPKDGCTRSDGHKATYRPVHTWDLGRPTRGATAAVTVQEPGPGVYKLCWGHDPPNQTLEEEQYPVEAGFFMMLGPLAMDFECYLHFPCTINISGIGLSATNMVLLVETAAGRCGDVGLPALDSAWSIPNPTTVSQDDLRSYNFYSFGIATGKSGASHRICWAHDPVAEASGTTYPLTDSALYRVEIDPDFFWIRLTAIVDCVLGRLCTVTIIGSGIVPSSGVLLVTNPSRCGDASAEAVDISELTNPAGVQSIGGASSTQGLYILGYASSMAPPFGFRVCWGRNPANASGAEFPYEVDYPMYWQPTPFFEHRVGSVGLVRFDSEETSHKLLALFSDPSDTPATSNRLTGSLMEWQDYDCCQMAGHAAGAVLQVDGSDRALPFGSYVFHERPSDDLTALALTTREPLAQGLYDCTGACDFTSKHTDYVLLAGFRDLSSPEKHPGNLMLLKAQPTGPQAAPTWQARRAAQHFGQMPPQSLADWEDGFRPCVTADPLAACAYASRATVQSLKVARLSENRLLAAFVDGPSRHGTVAVVSVSHHLPDHWSITLGLKQVVNSNTTSHVAVAALSDSAAVVFYDDEAAATVQARSIQVDAQDEAVIGDAEYIGAGSLTETNLSATDEGNETNSSYRATYRRMWACGLTDSMALVVFGPVRGATGQVVLVTLQSGGQAVRVAELTLRDSMDDVSLVRLSSDKAMVVYRDEVDGGVAKAQEVSVFENFNGKPFALGLGSTSTFTHFPVEGLTAVDLNATGVLAAYRAMDGSGYGMTSVVGASFNRH